MKNTGTTIAHVGAGFIKIHGTRSTQFHYFSMMLNFRQRNAKKIPLSTKLKDSFQSRKGGQKLFVIAPENLPFAPFLTLVGSSVGVPDR